MPASTPLRPLVDALEHTAALDAPGKALGKRVREVVPAGAVKDAISGTWFGHAVHPPLTDLVIGSFVSATVLDLIAPDSDQASERLIGLGLLAAVPTALTGVNDWSDSEAADDGIRRVGLVHAAGNVTALCLYVASLAARRRGATGRGRALAAAGATVLSAGGYLGGHLSFTRGVGPNQTAFDPGPDEWTEVVGAGEARDGEPTTGVASDTPVLLIRHQGQLLALHDRCSHRGCSLSDGELDGDVITCSCHGSQFDITDGSVIRGPATAGQPVLEARESDGRVEVRLQRRG
jgi:nitrite reductase/ring-hydroxylating ferredoxin subunit/uncharacterized membrane protein